MHHKYHKTHTPMKKLNPHEAGLLRDQSLLCRKAPKGQRLIARGGWPRETEHIYESSPNGATAGMGMSLCIGNCRTGK